MSKKAMLDTFKKHVDAELAGDRDTTMATTTANPHLHNIPSMVGGVGRDGVRSFYKTDLGAARPLRGKKRVSARLRPEGSGRYDFGGM